MSKYLLLVFTFWATLAMGIEDNIPRPPFFSGDLYPEEALAQYPLNVINRLLAFSYHGTADQKLTLPNGHTGWVYRVGGTPTHKLYVSPSGKESHLLEPDLIVGVRSYMLVFDEDKVVNVLYRYKDRDETMSALQIQSGTALGT